jgi:O-antigen/teichoic acid export membrane protein
MTQYIRNMFYVLRSSLSNGFLRQAGIYGIGQAVEGISSVLLLPVFLVYLNPDDFAIVALGDMAGMIMASFWGLRLSASVTRFYYEYSGVDRDMFVGTMWWAVVINAIGGLAIVQMTGPIILPYFVTQVAYSPYLELVVWTVFFRVFAEVPLAVMRIREEAHLVVVMTLGTFFLSVGAKLYYVVVAAEGGLGVLKAILLGSGVSALGYLIYMLRRYPSKIHWPYVKQAVRYCWPMTPDALLSGLSTVLDRFFLDKWVPLTLIGHYAVASQFGAIAYQTVVSLKMAFVPAAVRIWLEQKEERWRIGHMAFIFVALVAFVALGVSLFAQDLLLAFGRTRFLEAIALIPFTTSNAFLVALVTLTHMSFVLSKDMKWLSVVSIIHAAVALIMNLVLIPLYGVWGAVAATLSGWGSRVLSLAWLGHKVQPLPIPWAKIAALLLPVLPLMLLGVGTWPGDWQIKLAGKFSILLLYAAYIGVLSRLYERGPLLHSIKEVSSA